MHECTWRPEFIRTLPFFSQQSDAEFSRLLPSVRSRSFPARACILPSGAIPDGLYVLVSGRVRLVHQDQDGRALIAEIFGPRELFGEMGLVDGTASPVSVISAEDCEVVFIPRAAAVESLSTSYAAAMSLLRISLDRLCKAHRQWANLALTPVYGRVAQVLVANGHEAEGEWHVDVGSEQIAAMVGASREMVSRVLRCMIEKHLVRRYKRKLIVIEYDALNASIPSNNVAAAPSRSSVPA